MKRAKVACDVVRRRRRPYVTPYDVGDGRPYVTPYDVGDRL
ncbi:hypothetical protein AB0D34_15930 [Streptomyces sp. NPDC048420]